MIENRDKTIICKNKLFLIVITLVLSLYIFNAIPLYAIEILVTYNHIKTTFDALSRFLDTIYSFMSAISNLLGYRAIALFFAIAFTSGGLSAIGFPKGKTSFFISMIIINILWFTWNKSFKIDYIYTINTMLKTNSIILLPYFLFLIIKYRKDVIKKFMYKFFYLIFPFLKTEGIHKQTLQESIKLIHTTFAELTEYLMKDYFYGDDYIKLSDNSIRAIEQLENILKKIKESGKRK